MHTHYKFPRPSNDPSAVCFIGYLPWSHSKSFRAFDKGSVDKPWLEQTTRRRIKLVSRSNCFATNAAAFVAGIAVDVSLTCPSYFFLFYTPNGRPEQVSFFLFSKVWCGRDIWFGDLFLKDLTLVACVSECRDEQSNQTMLLSTLLISFAPCFGNRRRRSGDSASWRAKKL